MSRTHLHASPRRPAPRALVTSLLAALALCALAGCGAGATAFGDTFPDNRSEQLASVLARLEASGGARAATAGPAIALAVSAAPTRLLAYDLASPGQALWQSSVELRSVPQLAGRSVVTHEGNEIVVRSLQSGQVTGRFGDRSLNLIGAAGEGNDGIVVLSTGGGVGAFSVVQGLHDGAPSFTAQMTQALGAPAVSAGMAFVPWGHQNLSVIELGSGSEIARLRPSQGVVASAIARDGHVYFGRSGLALFGANTSPHFAALEQEMPASPQLLRDAYQPPQGPNSAQNRVRLVYRPVARGEQAAFDRGAVYLVFYRLVFALDATGRTARWVAQLPHDVIGAQVTDGGVLAIDDSGVAHLLSVEDGRETWTRELGAELVFATAAAEGLRGGAGDGQSGQAPPLRDQLLAAAQNSDARLVPLRELAVRLLAAMPEADVTANVIALCDDPSVTASVRAVACEALATRTSGADHVLAALGRHASFLRGVSAPPVGALARAAVAMNARAAVPLLVAHLRDPETAAADLAPLAQALGSFGDASAVEPLADFLRLYHAESTDAGVDRGLDAALRAYTTLAGPTARELLEQIAGDGLALAAVRNAARAQITALDAPATPEGGQATAPAAEVDMTITEADDTRPAELSAAVVAELLEPSRAQLERCLVAEGRVHTRARVVLVVDPQGQVLMVTANPPALQGCIEPIVRAATYPQTRARGRQQVTYEVRR